MIIKTPAQNNNEMHLQSLLRIVFLDKWLLAIITVCLLTLGIFSLLMRPSQYQTNAILQIENKPNKIENFSKMNWLFSMRTESLSDIDAALMKSRFILDKVIDKLGLDISVQPHLFPFIDRWVTPFSNNQIKVDLFDIPNSYVHERFKIITDDQQHFKLYDNDHKFILAGSVGQLIKNSSLQIALRVTQLNANPHSEFYIAKLSRERLLQSLSKTIRIEDVEGTAFNQFGMKSGILKLSLSGIDPLKITTIVNTIAEITREWDVKKKAQEMHNTLNFLYQQLPLAQKALRDAENAFKDYSIKTGKIDLNEESAKLFAELRDVQRNITTSSWQRSLLSSELTENHPDVIAIANKIKLLKHREQELQIELNTLPNHKQIALALNRDINMKNTLYMQLLSQIQEYKIAEAGVVSNVNILAPALLPQESLPRHLFTKIIMLGFFSLGIAMLSVLLRRRLQGYIFHPSWMEQQFEIPTTTVIPFSKTKPTSQCMLSNDDSITEAICGLYTHIKLSELRDKQIISLLGSAEKIGKSFIAVHLAHIIADNGKKVVIIDADLRRGKLENYFKLYKSPGLSELLIDAVTLENCLHKTKYTNLYFISSGYYPKKPSELLLRDRFKKILTELARQFDYIILDTPPLTTAGDSAIIAANSEINFMVIGSDTERSNDMQSTIKRLNQAGISIHGSIYNNLKKNTYRGTYGRVYQTTY